MLEGGEEIRGQLRHLQHGCEAHLPQDASRRRNCRAAFVKQVKNFKIRGSSGKVNIALDGVPNFTALPPDSPCIRGDLHFTDSIERMEKAYDDWKAGRWSRDPFLDTMIPTMIDPTMAPPGKHFMSCFVQYARPRSKAREWTDADRDAFGQTVHQPDRRLCAGLQGPRAACRSAHAARTRGTKSG